MRCSRQTEAGTLCQGGVGQPIAANVTLDARRLTSARVQAVLRVMTPNACEGSVEKVFESEKKTG